MPYVQTTYHIVWSTKYREPTLAVAGRPKLYAYIGGILNNKRCKPLAIGGVEDHLHLACGIHPTVAPSNLVKDIKLATSHFIAAEGLFPDFSHWQEEYSLFTHHRGDRPRLIRYIENQEAHHARTETSLDELRRMLSEHDIPFEERYLR